MPVSAERIACFPMDVDGGKVWETVGGNSFDVQGAREPVVVSGAVGKALRFDGYSSVIEAALPASVAGKTLKSLTFSVWCAAETYPIMAHDSESDERCVIAGNLDDAAKKGFAFCLGRDGKFILLAGQLTLGTTEEMVTAGIPEVLEEGVTAIVLPQTIAEGMAAFCFRVGEEEFVYEAPEGGVVFEAGKQYNYEICLNHYAGLSQKEILVNMTMENWNEVEMGTIMISKGEEATVALEDVVEGVTITKADLHFGNAVVSDVPVADGKMKFVFPRLVEDEVLTLKQACFYTAGGESFNYYFNDKQLIGNGADVLSLPAPKIGDSWGEGVVFVVGEVTDYDAETGMLTTDTEGVKAYKGRMIAAKKLGAVKWTMSGTQEGYKNLIGMSDSLDGDANLQKLEAFIASTGESVEDYPIYDALQVLDGWYVPSICEMFHILTNQEILNAAFVVKGGDSLDKRNENYTSSTEYAFYVDGRETEVKSTCVVGQMTTGKNKVAPGDKAGFTVVARIVKAF